MIFLVVAVDNFFGTIRLWVVYFSFSCMLVFSWENLQNVWHEECLLRSFKVTQDRCFCLFSSEKWLKESRSLVSIQGFSSWYFVDWRWWPSTHTHTTPYYYLVSFLFDCGSAADVCFCARFESTRECLRFCPFFTLDSTRRMCWRGEKTHDQQFTHVDTSWAN